jgi:hypothetical protein
MEFNLSTNNLDKPMFFNRKTIKPVTRLSLILGLAAMAVILITAFLRFSVISKQKLCCEGYQLTHNFSDYFYHLLMQVFL